MRYFQIATLTVITIIYYGKCIAADLTVQIQRNHKNFWIWNDDGKQKIPSNADVDLVGDFKFTASIGLMSERKYFELHSNKGYYFFADYSNSQIERSNIYGKLSSPMSYQTLQAGAALFVVVGKNVSKSDENTGEHFWGAGLGVGYAEIQHTIPAEFTKSGVEQIIKLNHFGIAKEFFYRYSYEEWFLEAVIRSIEINALDVNKQYSLYESYVGVGRIFHLN